jgi:hypothetical protein
VARRGRYWMDAVVDVGDHHWVNHAWEAVFLARHGQTEWNVERRRPGQLDSPLTDRGRTQAQRHAAMLRFHRIDAVQ